MGKLAAFVTGRRTKWVVLGLWIVAVMALSPLAAKVADVTSDETASFLPEDAQSTQVQALLKDRFPGGETSIGLIVYKRDGGPTPTGSGSRPTPPRSTRRSP
jgi:RND superfamily putative drug exporter